MSVSISLPRRDAAVVVVTGAAAGIGQATARAFARAGARMVLIDVDGDGLARTAQTVDTDTMSLVMSVSDEAAARQAASDVARQLGRCDVLVNNAGILLRGPLMADEAIDHWRQTLDVNLSGAFYMTRAFVPLLAATRGCIVNVASIHSQVAVANSVAYTASKGGLKQLTQALALELAPQGIRVNAVAPGSIDTEMTAVTRANPQAQARFLEKVPLARSGDVTDVANAIQFLASDLAGYITGVTLPVDGGYLAT